MKTLCIFSLIAAFASSSIAAAVDDGKPGATQADTVANVLTRSVGQRVELHMRSGEKITGTVKAVGDETVHISKVAGQELFDAVVVIEDISAVLIRADGK